MYVANEEKRRQEVAFRGPQTDGYAGDFRIRSGGCSGLEQCDTGPGK